MAAVSVGRALLFELADEMTGAQAEAKGYSSPETATNAVFEVTGLEHAIGEVIYKAIRYRARCEPSDLVKIIAWVSLIWEEAAVGWSEDQMRRRVAGTDALCATCREPT